MVVVLLFFFRVFFDGEKSFVKAARCLVALRSRLFLCGFCILLFFLRVCWF